MERKPLTEERRLLCMTTPADDVCMLACCVSQLLDMVDSGIQASAQIPEPGIPNKRWTEICAGDLAAILEEKYAGKPSLVPSNESEREF